MTRRITLFMVAGAMLLVLVAGVAVARTFQCGKFAYPCVGTSGDDIITERDGTVRDEISGLDGDDAIRVQVYRNDNDIVNGDQGNDLIRAADRDDRDAIDCGEGNKDRAVVDEGDAVNFSNCERVRGQRDGGPPRRVVAGPAAGDGLNEAVLAE